MMAWIGALGQMAYVKCPSALGRSTDRPTTYRTTLGGVRKAQIGPRVQRVLQVQHGLATPADVSAIEAMVAGEYGPGPFWYVDPWAEVTNLLTPQASVLEVGTYLGGSGSVVTEGGGSRLDDGTRAGRSVVVGSESDTVYLPRRTGYAGYDYVPVIPGVPVTASVYASGANASVRVQFLDAAGASTGNGAHVTSAGGSTLTRCAVTATPPAGSVSAYIAVTGVVRFARPAITWTSEVMEWSPGNGVARCRVSGLNTSAIAAHKNNGGRLMSLDFTVTEVG